MHLMVQPAVARMILGNPLLLEQGLISRCLVSWPRSTAGSRFYQEIDLSQDVNLIAYRQRIEKILDSELPLAEGSRNELVPKVLQLAPDAKRIWSRFYNHIEALLVDEKEFAPIRGFANKAAEHAARLAGVLTLVDDLKARTIPLEKIRSGIELTQYYLSEALRLHYAGTTDPDLVLAEKLLTWAKSWGEYVALPEIYQNGPNPIRDRNKAKRIAGILQTHGYFKRVDGGMILNGIARKQVWEVIS